jgi:hypothetical protein
MNEVQLQRWELLLTTCFDMGKGTLWKVREDVWKTYLRDKRYRSNRTWHPGLSVMRRRLESRREYVPMLHGTSDSRGPVIVKGITQEKGEDYTTSFGRIIRPAPLPAAALIPSGHIKQELPKDNPLRKCGMAQNTHKPRITDEEMKELDGWLNRRKLT